jgi:hypothetical protein
LVTNAWTRHEIPWELVSGFVPRERRSWLDGGRSSELCVQLADGRLIPVEASRLDPVEEFRGDRRSWQRVLDELNGALDFARARARRLRTSA